VHQLTTENESKFPDWSHDGSQITYTHQGDIYVVNANGDGQSVNLTNSETEDTQSTWSPDGSKIAWLAGNERNWNVFVMNADGSHVLQITDNEQIDHVEWTIDGRILTEWGWKNQENFCHNCVVNADGSNIVDAGGKDEVLRYQPFWTLDGQMVGVANVDNFTGDNEIYLVGKIFPDPQGLGAGFLNLTNNAADDRNPDWPANCGPGTQPGIVDLKPPKEAGKITIGYAGDKPEQWQRKNDFQKACEELAIQCVFGEISELSEQGVDAIIQNSDPGTVDDLSAAVLKAREKGIPVFVLNAELNAGGVYSVSIDRHQWVNTSLKWMLEKIGGKGNIAYFDTQPAHSDAEIIQDTLKDFPEITGITNLDEKYNFKESKSYVSDLMADYPDLKAIWANDALSILVLGMADTGIPSEKWPLLMCEPTKEGLFIWKDRLKDHPGMQCIAVSNPPGIAYDAVYAVYYLVTGAQIDESALGGQYGNSLYVDSPVVTNDNLLQWIEKINLEDAQYTVDELMEPAKIKEKWFLD
jgi:ABC-type sugar transport system substrate-binding protein